MFVNIWGNGLEKVITSLNSLCQLGIYNMGVSMTSSLSECLCFGDDVITFWVLVFEGDVITFWVVVFGESLPLTTSKIWSFDILDAGVIYIYKRYDSLYASKSYKNWITCIIIVHVDDSKQYL